MAICGVGIPGECDYGKSAVDNMGTEEKECLLYLPLYDELKSLEIGVALQCTHVRKIRSKKKIVATIQIQYLQEHQQSSQDGLSSSLSRMADIILSI